MRFSIIIPCYNSSKTICRCLDSAYALPVNETEFEVIVIDDCSTDETVQTIESYAENHSNLVLLVQPKNNRQGAARNRGMSIAQGKFVLFLDSDDTLDTGVISAIDLAESQNLEMTVMKGIMVNPNGVVYKTFELPYPRGYVFSGVSLQTDYPYWCSGPVLYLYRRSFLEEVRYPFAEGVLYEDTDFVNVHLYHAKRMGYCDVNSYYAIENSSSITHTISYKNACDYALLGTRMIGFYQTLENKDDRYAATILEGGSYNIMKSFRALFRLKSVSEVRSFYNRLDTHIDRKDYLVFKHPAYCWTIWTRLGLKHKEITITIVECAIIFHVLELRNIFRKAVSLLNHQKQ